METVQAYTRSGIRHKSVALKKRQEENAPQVIAYIDKANKRLRKRFYKMTKNKRLNRNVATNNSNRAGTGLLYAGAYGRQYGMM